MEDRTLYRRVVEALFSQYESTTRAVMDEQMELIAPEVLANARLEDTPRRYKWCPTAAMALETLVSAHQSYITPSNARWFNLRSRNAKLRHKRGSDRTSRWFAKATEVVADELAESNFYSVIAQVYRDRCFGTGCAFIGSDETHPLYFVHVPLGTFAIADDKYGIVDTLARKFKYTAHQAAQEWGAEALPVYVTDALQDESRAYTEQFEFIHLVRPNPKGRKALSNLDRRLREFEAVYLDAREYNVLAREGYFEFPYLVTRYARETTSPWGTGPGVKVLPLIRQLMKLERLSDAQSEIAAYPRILQLAGENGQVDVRAGGVTTVSQKAAEMGYPREWGTQGRLHESKDRIEQKKAEIRDAFHEGMLKTFANIDHQITAREVDARESEKVLSFVPSFTQFIRDNQALMRRVICCLARRSMLDIENAPRELFEVDKSGGVRVMNPNVSYLGKIAQAVERVMMRGTDGVLENVLMYTQATQDPRMLKRLNTDVILRVWMDYSGAPTDLVISDADAQLQDEAEMRAMQQQQAAMQQAEQAALENTQSQTVRNLATQMPKR